MAEKNKGKITQVISAVLDIKFPDGHLPEILNAITIDRGNGEKLTAEVSQHLGDDTVRCIAWVQLMVLSEEWKLSIREHLFQFLLARIHLDEFSMS